MGAKYGSILIRTNTAEALKPVLEKVAREQKCKFYLGPSLDGWASAFPDDYLDTRISEAISQELLTDIFHLTLFDDDVFGYVFYRNGRHEDQYNSCPDYINESSEEEKSRVQGRPEVFKDLLRSPDDLLKLKELLGKESYSFEQDRLREFADLLGLRNAIGNYEYLIDGERDEIKNWKQFIQIPDEKEAKRQARALLKATKKRLMAEGLLLAELLPPGPKRGAIYMPFHCCADRLNGGFLIGWSKGIAELGQPLLSFDPLKSKELSETGLKLNDMVFSFETSSSGKWLAMSHGKTEIWNWSQKTIAVEAELPSRAANLFFSPDERHLVVADTTEIVVVSLETGRTEYKFNLGSGGRACAVLHPNGEYMVATNLRNLCLINLKTRQIEKTPECKVEQSRELPPGPEMDEMIANLQKIYSNKERLNPALPMEKFLLESSLAGRNFVTLHSAGMVKYGFSRDGELLFCATESGLRVFRWNELLSAAKVMPKPVFYAVCLKNNEPTRAYTHDFFLDEGRNQIVFCGSFGKVCYLSLESGKSGILLDPPEDLWIISMALSSEGTTLGCTCTPNFEERNREVSKFQFWNYPALCKAAGLT